MKTRSVHRFYHLHLLSLIFCLFIAVSAVSAAQGKVMKVSDGDTAVISPLDGGEFYKCRLYGIDAPEISHGEKPGQPYGSESYRELKERILGQNVDVEIRDKDRYGRSICLIRKDGTDINLELVKKGAAWAYKQYLNLKRPHASEYIDAERIAREMRLGLWKDNNPQPPWEFRKIQRKK